MDSYSDIINLPHHRSRNRRQMTLSERAAQFAAFKALTGFEEEIAETARLTDDVPELCEEEINEINSALARIKERISEKPEAAILYFEPDKLKSGGKCLSKKGRIRVIDEVHRKIIFTDKSTLAIDSVLIIKFTE